MNAEGAAGKRVAASRRVAAGRGVAAVVLAAGAGSRFASDRSKLLVPWQGKPLVVWAINAAVDAGIGPVWVVTGATELEAVLPAGVVQIPNPRWADGQATSVAAALEKARAENLDAVVVGLADQPMVPAEAWRRVAGADAPIAVATYDGRRRNPVRLAAEVWDLLPDAGDEGARGVMGQHKHLVAEVACEGHPEDIDTVEDLARWS